LRWLSQKFDDLPPIAMAGAVLLVLAAMLGVLGTGIALLAGGDLEHRIAVARLAILGGGGLGVASILAQDLASTKPQSPSERLITALGAFVVTLALTGVTPNPGFYDTAAQIVPVLLLTLLVERRTLLLSERDNELDRGIALVAVLVLALGEGAALAAAANDEVAKWALGFVSGALAAGLTAILEMGFGERPSGSTDGSGT
jgi:hypothetical protein